MEIPHSSTDNIKKLQAYSWTHVSVYLKNSGCFVLVVFQLLLCSFHICFWSFKCCCIVTTLIYDKVKERKVLTVIWWNVIQIDYWNLVNCVKNTIKMCDTGSSLIMCIFVNQTKQIAFIWQKINLDICLQKLFVLRSEHFSKNIAQG